MTPPATPDPSATARSKIHPGQIFSSIAGFLKPPPRPLLKLLIGLIVLAVFYGVLALTVRYGKHHINSRGATAASYLFAFEVLLIVGIVVWLACRMASPPGLQYLYTGNDKRTSTSKIQYLIWTVGVAFALAYVSGHTFVSGKRFECSTQAAAKGSAVDCIPGGSIWEQYIILLGVPAAAAVVAKGITSYKVNNGIVQKVENSGSTGFSLTDVVGNDDGTPSLFDSQYLIFNVVAFIYVAVNFVQRGTLVNVPVMLLGLTSTAASVYALNKTLQANPPQVRIVTPKIVAPGTVVTIKGNNLMPSGSSESAKPSVTIGGLPASNVQVNAKTNTITATAVAGMNVQEAYLTVTTVADVTTEPYDLTILAGPTIVAWGAPPVRGQRAYLRVNGLPDDIANHKFEVIADGAPAAQAEVIGKDGIAFLLDNTVQPGQVDLGLLVDDVPSGNTTLTVH